MISSEILFLNSENNTLWKESTRGNYTMNIELSALPLPSQGSVAPLNVKIVNVPAVIFSAFPHLWMKVHLHVYLHAPATLCFVR